MSKSNVIELSGREETGDALTALLRIGARTLIERAVEAELVEFMARFEGRCLEDGRAAVVRNGYQPERAIETGIRVGKSISPTISGAYHLLK
jgi:putative transposase